MAEVNQKTESDDSASDVAGSVLALRNRIRGILPADSTIPEGDVRLDLNDEKNLVDLDDPDLRAYMDGARRRLREHEKTREQLPMVDPLRKAYIESNSNLSLMMADFDQGLITLRTLIDEAHIYTKRREQPEIKFQNTIQGFDKIAKSMEKHRNDICVVRRRFEELIDGLLQNIKYLENSRRLHREVLSSMPVDVNSPEYLEFQSKQKFLEEMARMSENNQPKPSHRPDCP